MEDDLKLNLKNVRRPQTNYLKIEDDLNFLWKIEDINFLRWKTT